MTAPTDRAAALKTTTFEVQARALLAEIATAIKCLPASDGRVVGMMHFLLRIDALLGPTTDEDDTHYTCDAEVDDES